jgi:hypothetical protein
VTGFVDRLGRDRRDRRTVMVTGTPRRLALAAIAELEAGPRGWYGGLAAVQVAANGDALRRHDPACRRDPRRHRRSCGPGGEPAGRLRAGARRARVAGQGGLAVARARPLGGGRAAVGESRAARDATSAPQAAGAATPLPPGGLPRAVALRDGGDPFAAAVTDALQACGVSIDPAAKPVVLIRGDAALAVAEKCRRRPVWSRSATRLRGSSAARAGPVRSIRPEHGRLVRCLADERSAAGIAASSASSRCAMRRCASPRRRWRGRRRAAWQVWVRDDKPTPLVLADARPPHRLPADPPGVVLSDIAALDVLKAALVFAATAPA